MGEAEVLVLSDGRELAWAELGRPDGVPVIALHGSPGTRCFLAPHGETARGLGVRLIAPDRPGYGLSTYDAGRTFRSGADDVRQLADHLGLDRFAVLGASSGGPNVAACSRFHGDRMFGCAIVSSPAPPEADTPKATIPRFNRVVRRGAAIAPHLTGLAFQ
ncbi:MAG: alpha/beta fold hydrolase, partial [Acidimicrobiales bacterium]